ncbi:phage tail length tape measure family protein [bacterium]|nr:phage tail length tape measure family protein [bacterium]
MADFGANMILKAKMDSSDFDQGMHRAQKSTKQFQDTTKKAQGQLRMMRGGLGQLGHQVQDVAVQLQMGQNAMLVFGQQGSQVASLFGPNGAIIGAVLAVSAALVTSLAPSLFGATEAMKMLDQASKELVDNYDDLTDAEKAYARSIAGKSEKEYEKIIKKLENTNRGLIDTYIRVGFSVTKITETEKERGDRLQKNDQRLATANRLLKALREKTDETTDAYTKFNEKMTVSNIRLREGALGVKLYNISISNMTDKEKEVASAQAKSLHIQQQINEEREKAAAADKALQLRQIMSGLNAEAQGIKQLQSERKRAEAKQISEAEAQQKRFESTRDQYTLQIASIGKTAEQIDVLKMRHAGLGNEQIAEIERLKALKIARQEAYDTSMQQQADDMILGDAFSSINDQFASMDEATQMALGNMAMSAISTVGTAMDQVSQLFAKGSGEAKAFMLVSKTLAAGNAIISGLVGEMQINQAYAALAASTGNPALLTVGNAHGALMKTMGFVNAGMIMGQAAASFDGGGFTGMGARAGGLDGKGGFPAILHPNETVIDHSKGQSMGTNVTINIQANDTKGFDELLRSRRGEIIGIVNKAINNRGVSSLI